MKIKSVLAVGAMGAGLGLASFIGGTGTASAACDDTPIPVLERGNCLVSQDLAGFAGSIDPAANLDILFNGTEDEPELGLKNWGQTFKDSVADFANGPRSSIDPPSSDPDPAS